MRPLSTSRLRASAWEVVPVAYVGILLVTILVSFVAVRIGGFALQLTGLEADIAKFQALSAFSGTGFTTTEAERVVRNRARRRIITILIILGNAGLVAIIATLVASFTQVTGYGWVFANIAIIIVGIFVLYRVIIGSRLGHRIADRFRRPLLKFVLKESPTTETVYEVSKDWGIHLVTIKDTSTKIGRSVADLAAEGDLNVLAIDTSDRLVASPRPDDRLSGGDRLVVYGTARAVRRLLQ